MPEMGSSTWRDSANPQSRSFAFIFPMASGHINPSLPIARKLVGLGHQAHYLCREPMREAIEDTGAKFHSDVEHEPELYEGRVPGLFGALEDLKKEHGLEKEPMARFMLQEVMIEMMLPGVIRWLHKVRASTVIYCPSMSPEAGRAAEITGIPGVALLTTAGPGSMFKLMQEILRAQGRSPADVIEARTNFKPLQDCLARLDSRYGLKISSTSMFRPLGKLDTIARSNVTLVSTCKALEDPSPPDLVQEYSAAGARIEYVGPLLDVAGACRAAGHKFNQDSAMPHGQQQQPQKDPVALQREARAAGRKVVLVSMGTMITGDSPDYGWDARLLGGPRGLTGKELCQAAWAGAFDAFREDVEPPLLLVVLGPQPDALGSLEVPSNAHCVTVLPQVDVLKAGVDLFLTHGGQNSFTEALSLGVPLVVCPGFADQPVNAQKAEDMGVGLQVKRPMPEAGQEVEAAKVYRKDVAEALRSVMSQPCFRAAAGRCAEELRTAGGVPRAVELVLGVSSGASPGGDKFTTKVATPVPPVENAVQRRTHCQ